MSNNNKPTGNSQEEFHEIVPKIVKIHPSILSTITKAALGFIAFLGIGYYTLWMSANYVKRETFENYAQKQDDLFESKFGLIQNRLESILNQQIIATEQFKNLNLILATQQKSIDITNERLTFLERSIFKQSKTEENKN
jgi:hypothetical protein